MTANEKISVTQQDILGAYNRKEYGWFALYILAVVLASRLAGVFGVVVSVIVVAALYKTLKNSKFSKKKKVTLSLAYILGGMVGTIVGVYLLSSAIYNLWPQAYIASVLSNDPKVSNADFVSSSTPNLASNTTTRDTSEVSLKYIDAKWKFSINYPKTWTVDMSGTNGDVEFDNPTADDVALETISVGLADSYTPETYSQAVMHNFKVSGDENSNIKIISEGRTTLGGNPAYEYEVIYNYVNSGKNYPFHGIYITSIFNNLGYTIFASSFETTWAQNIQLFNSSIESFTFSTQ
ncbi:MAG: PsbP [Parcubacteria group bacterium]|nr:PsbP [Parcubacteria group bacterium]